MGSWFRTPKQKFYATFFGVIMLLFGVLTAISMGDGTEVWSKTYDETQFESESMDDKLVGNFEIDSREVCMVRVKGLTLDQSWLWVKVLILDEKSRPIHDYKFDLSYYHGVEGGESWSEGDQDDYKVFILPKGKYSVVIYGEDENPAGAGSTSGSYAPMFSSGYTTVDRLEKIQVTVTKDVMLTRYFLMLFIVFLTLLVGYVYIRSERSKTEVPVYYDYTGGGGAGGYVDPYAATDYTPSGPTGPTAYPSHGEQGQTYDLTDQAAARDPENKG